MTVISGKAASFDLGQAYHCLEQMEDSSLLSIFISLIFVFLQSPVQLSCFVSKTTRWWSKALWTEGIFLIQSYSFLVGSPPFFTLHLRLTSCTQCKILCAGLRLCIGLCSYCPLRFFDYDYNLCFMQNSSRILWRNPAPQQPQGHPLCHQLLHYHRPWRTHVSQLLKPHNFDLLPWDGLWDFWVWVFSSAAAFYLSPILGIVIL